MDEQQTTATSGGTTAANPNVSDKNGIVVLILCLLLGYLGVHRFFVGKIGTGVLMLITMGGCGIWQLIDIILILVGSFTDVEGRVVKLSN